MVFLSKYWKYIVVFLAGALITSILWYFLTGFFRQPKIIISRDSDAEKKLQIYKKLLDDQKKVNQDYAKKIKALESEFYKEKTDEELCDGLDNLLDLNGSCRSSKPTSQPSESPD